jgi:hypothetical protein
MAFYNYETLRFIFHCANIKQKIEKTTLNNFIFDLVTPKNNQQLIANYE